MITRLIGGSTSCGGCGGAPGASETEFSVMPLNALVIRLRAMRTS